jgi:hypothetical protein
VRVTRRSWAVSDHGSQHADSEFASLDTAPCTSLILRNMYHK